MIWLLDVQGWQAGLIAGSAFTVIVEALARAFIAWRRFRGRKQCDRCNGDLNEDGSGVGSLQHLCLCPLCGDTRPHEFVLDGDVVLGAIVGPAEKHEADVLGIRTHVHTENGAVEGLTPPT